MRRRLWWLTSEVVPPIAILLVSLWVLSASAAHARPSWDEGFYIGNSRYFYYLFVEHDVTRREWRDSFATHTQPMLVRYVVGAWFWLHGYTVDRIPPPTDYGQSYEQNVRRGAIPGPAMQALTRAPMIAIAALAIVLLYLLGRVLVDRIAGLGAAAAAIAGAPAEARLIRAQPEALLVMLLILTLLIGMLGMRRGRRGSLPVWWAVALGVTLGLGLQAKLTMVLSLVSIVTWMTLVMAIAARGDRLDLTDRLSRAWRVGRGWALSLAVALAVWVVTNPHVYPDPIAHTWHYFPQQYRELVELQGMLPDEAVHDRLTGARLVLTWSFVSLTASGSRGVPLEAALALVGGGVLVQRAWRTWRRWGRVAVESWLLVTLLVYLGGIGAGLYLAWDRYGIPSWILVTLLSGAGLSASVRLATMALRQPPPTAQPGEPETAARQPGGQVDRGHAPS